MNKTVEILRLARPHQHVKNGFVLLPLFFGGRLYDADAAVGALIAFAAFCLAAGAVYVVNDIRDAGEDRLHPVKRLRPIAAGRVSTREAVCFFGALVLCAGALSLLPPSPALIRIIGVYIVLNLAYSFYLKHIAVVDVLCIAIGFVLRIFAGGVGADVAISPWIIIMTFLLALFLALGKRRDDLLGVERGRHGRKSLDGYNMAFVTSAMVVMASVIIVSFILYSVSPGVVRKHGDHLYLTGFWVIAGLLRYLQIALVEERAGSPTRLLLKDPFLLGVVLLWFFNFYWLIY